MWGCWATEVGDAAMAEARPARRARAASTLAKLREREKERERERETGERERDGGERGVGERRGRSTGEARVPHLSRQASTSKHAAWGWGGGGAAGKQQSGTAASHAEQSMCSTLKDRTRAAMAMVDGA